MADAPTPAPPGFHFKGNGSEVEASQETVNNALSALERIWYHTLDWISQHRPEFVLILLLLAWWIYQRRRGRTDVARMTEEYRDARTHARDHMNNQGTLPLTGTPHAQPRRASVMNSVDLWPVIGVGLLMASWAAHRRLVRAAQPLRIALAEKGERLLAHEKLPSEFRPVVEFMLDTAFRNYGFLITGFILVPVIALCTLFRPSMIASRVRQLSSLDPEVQARFLEVSRIHDRVTLSNHPILLTLLEFEIILFMPLTIVLVGLTRGWVPLSGDRDTVMTALESREAKFLIRRRLPATA